MTCFATLAADLWAAKQETNQRRHTPAHDRRDAEKPWDAVVMILRLGDRHGLEPRRLAPVHVLDGVLERGHAGGIHNEQTTPGRRVPCASLAKSN